MKRQNVYKYTNSYKQTDEQIPIPIPDIEDGYVTYNFENFAENLKSEAPNENLLSNFF